MTIPLTLSCDRVDSYYWDYNKDKNNWLCSGQGKADLKICVGFGQAINPSIASSYSGTFKIVWQGIRETDRNIYSAMWVSGSDILYSSGQGLYDKLEMDEGSNPIIINDPAFNFYISGSTRDNIKFKECGPIADGAGNSGGGGNTGGGGGGGNTDPIFEEFCYPGELATLGSSYDQIKMRVYKEDTSGSLVVNDDKVVSVVNQRNIRLDVVGIVGAYAVRVRNMEDSEWSGWTNIDNELHGVNGNGAYRIDNNRFLVDWEINNYNGLRRICCRVLTMYGISNTFCVEVYSNFEVPQHVFKFYKNSDGQSPPTYTDEFPKYNGQYVLSTVNATTDGPKGGKMVYFDAEFSSPLSDTSGVKFNVVQQGINDKINQTFTGISPTKLSGEFEIFDSDGIFNKDGAAFIEIVFPTTTVPPCPEDTRDNYNYINSDQQEIDNIDLIPEEVYEKYQRDILSKAIDINKFRNNYDKDDTNFKFGDPGHYRK
jgi:hypothetical protein